MPKTLLRRHALLGALVLPAAACRSPDPALYTLLPVPGEVRRSGPRAIMVHEIALARYLDRQQIVRSSQEYRLEVSGNDWWGEPLDAMLTRLLVENVAQRLPQSSVVASTGAISSPSDATVEVNVQRLGLTGPQTLALTAQIAASFRTGNRRDAARTEAITVPVEGTDTRAFVAAASAATGRLADAVAALLTN